MSLLRPDAEAFPARPPADLRDARAIAENDWEAFRALEAVTNHWARPQWPDGARAYYWMLTFPHALELSALARRCQKEIASLGLDDVPADQGLHVTVRRVGSPKDVTSRQLDDVVSAAGSILPSAFDLRVIPMTGSRGAVRFSVAPWEPLVRLHATLAEAGRKAGCSASKPTAAFRPHLSIAYHNAPRSAAPVIEAVASLRSLAPLDVGVSGVQLVELSRQGRQYHWQVLHSLPLARGSGAHRVD
ncbi:2'-5' RNA ligase family protein [Streptomyces sp. 4N509B]|uniref:2'-5' RNA ligase family protein n=1 Tax=Streptomyces sp. 4N509B TaxID=3457413 RepID=UPI003FD2921D